VSAKAWIDPLLSRRETSPDIPDVSPPPVEAARIRDVSPAGPTARWLSSLYGRVGEISGSRATAALTLAMRLVLEAQRRGEPVAWIARGESMFYPPDVAGAAVDLDALVVVRAPEIRSAARAADLLVRSGAFGLVILDLGANARVEPPVQARLVGLAHKHHSAVVYLTEKERERPSVGSLISMRVEAARVRLEHGRFLCEARILKDKRRGPGGSHEEICHGPDGLH
jgi:recombination protein RecA